jgi:uncharacterized protein (DUF1330 family)
MKSPFPTKFPLTMAASLLVGVAIGCGAMSGLHAQTRPPAFTIAEVDVIDPAAFQAFVKRFSPAVAAAGGHFIANVRGRVVATNGTPPKGVNLIAWDSLEQTMAFFNSPTFKALIPLRDKGAKVRVFQVEGLPK